ncbi:hypothetical protein AAG906_013568 [Vitis piasezkii]
MPSSRPVRQKVRRFHQDKQRVIQSEVDKLLTIEFIKEVKYLDWLANVMVVPKKSGKCQVCIDYTNLNDIPMFQPNEKKTTFMMPHGLYYKVMLFGLKNASATYQKLMTKIFKPLISRTVEVYINDIEAYNMNLNSAKCAFGISVDKFLGFMQNELQRLTGRLAALGRFIARFTNKPRPFFLTLKGASATGWTDEYGRAFNEVKRYLTQPPILSSPQSCEQFYMYLVMFNYAVDVVMFHHIRDKEQRLIYYLSKAMVNAETRYSKMEQTTLALKSSIQKLCPYFQAHQVVVLTNQPLKSIFHKLDLSGRMLKWVIELSEYEIKYQPRLAMKGQVMADFIAKLPQNLSQLPDFFGEGWWILHVDGTSKASDVRVGLILQSPIYEAKDERMAYYLGGGRTLSKTRRMSQKRDDIVGPLPIAAAQKKFLLVATNYFSKWVEAEAYASIKDKKVSKFIWENIVCRFKDPLPEVLWAYRTTPGRPIETTPFAPTYGMDVVIPTEIGMPTAKIFVQGQKNENHELERHLDWADETKGKATIWMASYQQIAITHYNKKKARPRMFRTRTLVLKRVFENTIKIGAKKLQANWEGPYVMTKVRDSGAYHLQTLDGVPRSTSECI